jgi:hypothetical protein
VDDDTILYVHVVANTDVMHIASHHGVKPNTAVITHFHFTDDCSIFGNETVGSEFRRDTFDRINESHYFN